MVRLYEELPQVAGGHGYRIFSGTSEVYDDVGARGLMQLMPATGRTLAAWQADRAGGIAAHVDLMPLIVLPERTGLNARIDARLAAMFDGGAIEEVGALTARSDVDPAAAVRRAIGVREIEALLAGTMSRDAALAEARAATRRYAKRQYTWFRHQPPKNWPRVEDLPLDRLEYYFNLTP